jgi:hypothetical protein
MLISRVATCRATIQDFTSSRITATKALAGEISSFSSIIVTEIAQSGSLALLASRGLSLSALFLLLDGYTCPERLSEEPGYSIVGEAKNADEHELQMLASRVVQQASNEALTISGEILRSSSLDTESVDGEALGRISPLTFDILYCALATFHWYCREGDRETAMLRIIDLNTCLQELGQRWGLAKEYLTTAGYHDPSNGVMH